MHSPFVDTKIATKTGSFKIRVYNGDHGKETIVLYTEDLNINCPVLVRVHSECVTGDMLGSLHCDCGEQFSQSLQLIKKEGGVLIYLRQEGRGIGLFEKIKAYDLQCKGYDTFEANVMLGHKPDERTYEMAKTALDDLNIKRIRLITNNMSKVSELSKLGIEVMERVPIIIKPNACNKHYLETKAKKFKHLLTEDLRCYFYQFHADSIDIVKQIWNFIEKQKLDPFLRIGIGISVDKDKLADEAIVLNIQKICSFCDSHEKLIPIFHFSFLNSSDVLKDAKYIKEKLPFIRILQANDLTSLEVKYVRELSELFNLHLPVCDDIFSNISNPAIVELLKKNKVLVLLDNSKGRGIQDSKESFMQKIDVLLNLGVDDIAVSGGFGPDELCTYFDLKRHYKINFSIDAETKLKTNGTTDFEKVNIYLWQLIKFIEPKHDGIEQTRAFLRQHQRTAWEKVTFENREFLIHPQVFHAGHFPSTKWFANVLRGEIKDCQHFCEIGCGAGIISCLVGLDNHSITVVASDINSFASENTMLNSKKLGLADRVQVFTGDVLDTIPTGKQFDFIFWALPFGYLDPGTKVTLEDLQVFDPGYRALRKFFQTAKKFLKQKGKLLLGFSPDLGHASLIEELAKESRLKICVLHEKTLTETNTINFQLLSGTYF